VSISISPATEGIQIDAISLLICSTVLVSRVCSAWILFLSNSSSVAYSVFVSLLDGFEVLELGGKLLLLLMEVTAVVMGCDSIWSES